MKFIKTIFVYAMQIWNIACGRYVVIKRRKNHPVLTDVYGFQYAESKQQPEK